MKIFHENCEKPLKIRYIFNCDISYRNSKRVRTSTLVMVRFIKMATDCTAKMYRIEF